MKGVKIDSVSTSYGSVSVATIDLTDPDYHKAMNSAFKTGKCPWCKKKVTKEFITDVPDDNSWWCRYCGMGVSK